MNYTRELVEEIAGSPFGLLAVDWLAMDAKLKKQAERIAELEGVEVCLDSKRRVLLTALQPFADTAKHCTMRCDAYWSTRREHFEAAAAAMAATEGEAVATPNDTAKGIAYWKRMASKFEKLWAAEQTKRADRKQESQVKIFRLEAELKTKAERIAELEGELKADCRHGERWKKNYKTVYAECVKAENELKAKADECEKQAERILELEADRDRLASYPVVMEQSGTNTLDRACRVINKLQSPTWFWDEENPEESYGTIKELIEQNDPGDVVIVRPLHALDVVTVRRTGGLMAGSADYEVVSGAVPVGHRVLDDNQRLASTGEHVSKPAEEPAKLEWVKGYDLNHNECWQAKKCLADKRPWDWELRKVVANDCIQWREHWAGSENYNTLSEAKAAVQARHDRLVAEAKKGGE